MLEIQQVKQAPTFYFIRCCRIKLFFYYVVSNKMLLMNNNKCEEILSKTTEITKNTYK